MLIYLLDYEDKLQQGRDLIDCGLDSIREREKACRVNLDTVLGDQCTKENDFGYEDGTPCVLIKMNRVRLYTVYMNVV